MRCPAPPLVAPFPGHLWFLPLVFTLFPGFYTPQNFPLTPVFNLPRGQSGPEATEAYATTNYWFADVCCVGIGICAGSEC